MRPKPTGKTYYVDVYLAFFDILGFKELVRNNTHEQLEGLVDLKLGELPALCLSRGKVAEINGKWRADTSQIKINSMIMSDSAIFWSKSDSPTSLIDIIGVSHGYFDSTFRSGLPTRGCISMGRLSVRTAEMTDSPKQNVNTYHTLFGQALVNAYEKAESQEWAGCIIDKACLERCQSMVDGSFEDDLLKITDKEKNRLVVKHDVPFKTGVHQEYVLNWTRGKKYLQGETEIRECFTRHNKPVDNDSVKAKISNTVRFWDSM